MSETMYWLIARTRALPAGSLGSSEGGPNFSSKYSMMLMDWPILSGPLIRNGMSRCGFTAPNSPVNWSLDTTGTNSHERPFKFRAMRTLKEQDDVALVYSCMVLLLCSNAIYPATQKLARSCIVRVGSFHDSRWSEFPRRVCRPETLQGSALSTYLIANRAADSRC